MKGSDVVIPRADCPRRRAAFPTAACALFFLACGSRGAVDLLGGPSGSGPTPEGGRLDAFVEPLDVAAPTDRGGAVAIDAGSDIVELDQGIPPIDHAAPPVDSDTGDAGRFDAADAADGGPCAPGEVLCGGRCVNLLTDNDNCGVCNLKCNVFMSSDTTLGGCKKGLCDGAYGACFAGNKPYFTCDEVCGREGTACVQAGCMGATHIEYQYTSDCEEKHAIEIRTSEACNQPMQLASGYRAGRCCCAKRPGEKM